VPAWSGGTGEGMSTRMENGVGEKYLPGLEFLLVDWRRKWFSADGAQTGGVGSRSGLHRVILSRFASSSGVSLDCDLPMVAAGDWEVDGGDI